jgi:hypothetical protein
MIFRYSLPRADGKLLRINPTPAEILKFISRNNKENTPPTADNGTTA